MRVEQRLHRVAQLERSTYRLRALVVGRDVQRKERRAHAGFPEPGQIHVALPGPAGDVLLAVEHPLQGVDVAVDANRLGVDFPRARDGVLSSGGRTLATG
jgi:hypothetical protein